MINTKDFSEPFHKKIFFFWLNRWREEISLASNGKKILYSDEYTKQSSILAIYEKEKESIIATALFYHLDFRHPATIYDSYFRLWDKEHIENLKNHGNKVMISTYCLVNEKYRGRKSTIRWKDAIFWLVCDHFYNSDSNSLAITSRNNKGMTNLGIKLGADVLSNKEHDVFYNDVSLLKFTKESVRKNLYNQEYFSHFADLFYQNNKLFKVA